ncbi:META domain-containing protein [Erythrobacter sp. WG]|uniref:META domain-containing protein n=1 Tax=Erythrobacter sp. WG TaxID=2985510 RepID=UPI00227063D0|nr:META domain-containing protein [Erythrobacter sp. WG]MCX9147774.1 META domain-containing protein [Erythrobacter sp. WG]
MKTTIAAASTATLLLGACVTVPASHPLTGSQWQLVSIDASGSTTALNPEQQARHTLAFGEEGAAQVKLDCNRGRTTWIAGQPRDGASTITFGPVASTRMICPEPSFGNQLASALGLAQRFSRSSDGRKLVIEAPDARLTFVNVD